MGHDPVPPTDDRARLERSLRSNDLQFRNAIEKNADGILVVSGDGLIRYANSAAEDLLRRPAEELLGQSFGVAIRPGDTTEIDILHGCQPSRIAEVRVVEIEWEGQPASLATLRDVTERKRAAEAAEFLAEVGAVLAGSLDFPRSLTTLARVTTAHLADACLIDLAEADRFIHRVSVAHRDPVSDATAQGLLGHFRPETPPDLGPAQVLKEGRTELHVQAGPDLPTALGLGVTCPSRLGALACRSALLVPLRAGGRVFGVVTLLRVSAVKPFGTADVALAEEFARRTALAVDNARLYHDAREAVQNRDRFLAMLAHELRNPLAPIRNAGQLLRMGPDVSPSVRETASIIDRQVIHMSRLVDDLLDVSRVSRNKIKLRREDLDLKDVIGRSVEIARPLIDARGHELGINLPPSPVILNGDLTRLAQVFGNLLVNAAKYTPERGRIRVTAEHRGQELWVSVIDSGIGMTPQILSQVFEPFVQADTSADRPYGGLGLGLTLVRSLVGLHGGSVEASSSGPGAGSTFVVRLPLSAGVPAPPAPALALPSENTTQARRVLVIDDNVDSATSLMLLLRAQGHTAHAVFNGPDALAAAHRLLPEVVLLDIGLPGMDGYEVARRLRLRPETAGVLLIALTGHSQEEDYRRSEEAGFDRHLVKPVKIEVLEQLVSRPQEYVLPGHRVPGPDEARQSGSSSNKSVLILNVDDEEVNRVALSRILRRAGYEVLEAASGHQALAMVSENPDLILLDVNLPDIDGIEVCRRVKENAGTAPIPVVLLSGFFTHSGDRVQGLQHGADVYLTRPIEPDELLAQVEGLLRVRRAQTRHRSHWDKLVAATRQLRQQRTTLKSLLDVLPVPVIVVESGTGIVTAANKSAHRLADGCFPDSYVLTPGMSAEGLELEWPTSSGIRRVLTFAESLPAARGQAAATVVVFVDVTHFKTAEGELRHTIRAQQQCLRMLGKALRPPRSPIARALKALRRAESTQRQIRTARLQLMRQIRRLRRRINDGLDQSGENQGGVSPVKHRLDLARIVQAVVKDSRAAAAGLTIDLTMPETPTWIMSDADCLRHGLKILLKHSANHAPAGARLLIRLDTDPVSKEATLTLSTEGNEASIGPESRISESFPPAEPVTNPTSVRELIDLLGGKLVIRSAGADRGTTIAVSVPLIDEPSALSNRTDDPVPSGERLRILIVEDNIDSAETLRMLLQLLGNDVSVAYTGPEGVRCAIESRPDVVLCDIGLPGLDGYGVAEQLRRTEITARTRLIAVTGYGSDEDRLRCFQVGFDAHLTKPVDPSSLKELLVGP